VDTAAVSVRGMATVTRIGARITPSVGVAVVGAGPAGLAASSRLARSGCSHVVLERERVAWSWRSQRWDSFRLNTPRWANRVPGEHLEGEPGSFASAPMLVAALERFADGLPVVEGVEVQSARRTGRGWRLDTSYGALTAGAVVVASGFQNVPRRPAYADALPAELGQLHIADYRRPDDLEDGVLVVGGGQSGVQIADELLEAGKRVYLSTSRVGRLPRRYLGRDAMEWMRESGQLDLPADQADPATLGATPPQVSGAGGGRTLSYQGVASSSHPTSARTFALRTRPRPSSARPGRGARRSAAAPSARPRSRSPRTSRLRACITFAAPSRSTSRPPASRQ
jgi:putative flavoprotein involved in K+ transport